MTNYHNVDITDFIESFHPHGIHNLNLPTATNTVFLWRTKINDTTSRFYGFSHLIYHLFTLIDSHLPCDSITLKNLNVHSRCDIMAELDEFDILYSIDSDDNTERTLDTEPDICINTSQLWTIPDIRLTWMLDLYQQNIDIFNRFYSSVSTIWPNYSSSSLISASIGGISVSLDNFIQFKNILSNTINSYNIQWEEDTTTDQSPDPFSLSPTRAVDLGMTFTTYEASRDSRTWQPSSPTISPPPIFSTQQILHSDNTTHSNNYTIKHELADLIFDIKDTLSDSQYKLILDKIADISI